MTRFDELLKKSRDYLIIRLQRLAAQDIRDLRAAELNAITGQAELLQANGLFTVCEADALIVHAREVFDGRAQPSADANW
ncbi:hypothetical protein VQ574_20875 (plasmid) [Stutzerimonas frequens]|uniref:hypothetical protein n=1 Tax=Stutzerimonas frequens TaxID=2968969 RepID=UPI002DBF2DC9|nr:hypothetical protein [Stutzerimonas frequens]WRW29394.1 hypothetical protein VQ574_20875 [Stutzerimonas frequens]